MAFADFSNDMDDDFDKPDESFSDYLTVEAYLELHFGAVGLQVYRRLKKMAEKTTEDVGGDAGIIFNEDGGEFVSFNSEDGDEDEAY